MSEDLEQQFTRLLFDRPGGDDDAGERPPGDVVVPAEGGNPSPAGDDDAGNRRFARSLFTGSDAGDQP